MFKMKPYLFPALRTILFFCLSLIVWRFLHGVIIFTPESLKLMAISSFMIALLFISKANKIILISGVIICWLIASGVYPQINQYIFFVIIAYLGIAIYIRSFTVAIIAGLFIIINIRNEIVVVNELKQSPQIIEVKPNSAFDILASKIDEKKLRCNKDKFLKGVRNLGVNNDVNPGHLLFIMWLESGINPYATSPNPPYATGLIQFTKSTCEYMGYNYEDVLNTGAMSQLLIIDKYLKMHSNKIIKCTDIYMLSLIVFYPAAINKISKGENFIFPEYVVNVNKNIFKNSNDYKTYKKYINSKMSTVGLTAEI